ncbi:MAG: tetratricopeptide repeat protein, partial [Planctomycetota bacterium]
AERSSASAPANVLLERRRAAPGVEQHDASGVAERSSASAPANVLLERRRAAPGVEQHDASGVAERSSASAPAKAPLERRRAAPGVEQHDASGVAERSSASAPAKAPLERRRAAPGVEQHDASGVAERSSASAPAKAPLEREPGLEPRGATEDPHGEGETPLLADFGLARLQRSHLTRTGELLGTPAYMAPEQAAGERGEQSPALDVYGLGALLYALLTGRPPCVGSTPLATLDQVLAGRIAPPSRLRPDLCPRLEEVCLRALARDPGERPPGARELAEELEAWAATPTARARRAWLAPAVAALLLAALGGVALGRATRPAPPQDEPPRERPQAEHLALLRTALEALDLRAAEETLRAAEALEPDRPELAAERGWLLALRGDFPAAEQAFARAGEGARACYLHARALIERGRRGQREAFAEAVPLLERSLELEPTRAAAGWLALVRLNAHEDARARADWERAQRLPGGPEPVLTLVQGVLAIRDQRPGEGVILVATELERSHDPWVADSLATQLIEVAQHVSPEKRLEYLAQAQNAEAQALARRPDDPVSHLRTAQILELQAREVPDGEQRRTALERALPPLRRALELDPELTVARVLALNTLRSVGRADEAYELARAAAERHPAEPRLAEDLAGVVHSWALERAASFDPAPALPRIDAVLARPALAARGKGRALLLGVRARLLAQQRRWEESEVAFAAARAAGGDEVDAGYHALFRAESLLERATFDVRQLAAAEACAERALAHEGDGQLRGRALAVRAWARRRRDPAQAEQDAADAAAAWRSPRLATWAGAFRSVSPTRASTLRLFAQARARAPRDPYLLASYAQVLAGDAPGQRSQPDVESALDLLQRAFAGGELHPAPLAERARILCAVIAAGTPPGAPRREVFARARADLDRALALEPGSPELLKRRGQVLIGLGQLPEALADLRRALTLAPEDAEVRRWIGALEREAR